MANSAAAPVRLLSRWL